MLLNYLLVRLPVERSPGSMSTMLSPPVRKAPPVLLKALLLPNSLLPLALILALATDALMPTLLFETTLFDALMVPVEAEATMALPPIVENTESLMLANELAPASTPLLARLLKLVFEIEAVTFTDVVVSLMPIGTSAK